MVSVANYSIHLTQYALANLTVIMPHTTQNMKENHLTWNINKNSGNAIHKSEKLAHIHQYIFDVRKFVHHHTIRILQAQQDATVSQVYYLTFMCGSTCFGRLPARHQEHTTALGASGFTVGEKQLEPLLSNGKTRGF